MGFTGAKYYLDEVRSDLVYLFKDRHKAHVPCNNKEKQDLVCPCCGSTYQKSAYQLYRNKNILCDQCNDGYSVPEKFMMSILNQLNIDYVYQYTSDWAKNYKYDFKFVLNSVSYLVETDGGIGHGIKTFQQDEESLKKSIERDEEKTQLAAKNNFILIRINCNYNNDCFSFLENSFRAALLNILDLSVIDWNKCKEHCLNSKFKEVIDCYLNQTEFTNEIATLVNIKQRTVIKYLKEAMNANIIPHKLLCHQGTDIIDTNSRNFTSSKYVYCYEDDRIFQSLKEASNYYHYNYRSFIYAINNNENGWFKKEKRFFIVKDSKDIEKIKKEQSKITVEQLHSPKHKKRPIYQYTLNYELKNYYEDYRALPIEYKFQTISKACHKNLKSAYGYIWSYEKL